MKLLFLTREKSTALMFLAAGKWSPMLTVIDFSEDGSLKTLAENTGIGYHRFVTWEQLKGDWTLIISCRLNRKIPDCILKQSRYGGINIHPSLLPKYSGPNPWFEAYCANDLQGGVTIHRLTDDVDGGDILARESFEIHHGEPLPVAMQNAGAVSARLLEQVLDKDLYKFPGKPQESVNHTVLNIELHGLKTLAVGNLWHVLRGFPELLPVLFPLPHRYFEVGSYSVQVTDCAQARIVDDKIFCKDGVIKLIDFGSSAMASDYIDAIDNRRFGGRFLDAAEFDRRIDGTLSFEQGREAIVFPLTLNGRRYVLRCMKNMNVSDVNNYLKRMSALATKLASLAISHFVGFRVIERAFDTPKGFLPAVLMDYNSGQELHEYLLSNIRSKMMLQALLDDFTRICTLNHRYCIVHGDLHGGNLRIDSDGKIKILDIGNLIIGCDGTQPDYGAATLWQHQTRVNSKYLFDGIDSFSEIIIYVNILVAIYAPELYLRFLEHGNIFRVDDYLDAHGSALLKAMTGVPKLECKAAKLRTLFQVNDIKEIMSFEKFVEK